MFKMITFYLEIEFKNGIKRLWSLSTAHSTIRNWNKNIEKWLPDNTNIKDAKKLLNIAKMNFPKYKFKIFKKLQKLKKLKKLQNKIFKF